MAVTRNQPIKGAPADCRRLLGRLLFRRREELGYGLDARPRFQADRGINKRYAHDIENAARDNFTEPWLKMIAQGYAVTYESILDVAWGRADGLTPAGAHAAPVAPGLPDGEERSLKRYTSEISRRIGELGRRGIHQDDITGAQLFPGPGEERDAAYWDERRAALDPVGDCIWMVAAVRRAMDLNARRENDRAG